MVRRPLLIAFATTLAATWPCGAPQAAASSGDAAQARAAEIAARHYDRAVRRSRAGDAVGAIELFEKALPHRNHGSDIFYNLVQASQAARRWRRVLLYAQGFLAIEPDGADAAEIRGALAHARGLLEGRSAGPVEVHFDVEPAGAWIWVDHTPVAIAGGEPAVLMPGRYEAVAKRRDYEDWEQRVVIPAGRSHHVTASMVPRRFEGRLHVQPDPAEEVEVYVDDRHVGTTPLEPLTLQADKRYLVRFERSGYDRWVRYVVIPRDDTFVLAPKMETLEQALRAR